MILGKWFTSGKLPVCMCVSVGVVLNEQYCSLSDFRVLRK